MLQLVARIVGSELREEVPLLVKWCSVEAQGTRSAR